MAVRSLGQLTLDLVARVGGFTGPMSQASRAAKTDMDAIAKAVRGATATITAAAGTITAASGALVLFTKSAADNATELRNQANLANAGVEEFQRYAYASNTVGVEQDKLADILKDVTDRVGDFLQTGGGPMADFFEQIAPRVGVTADQFRNLSGPQALQLYVDTLQKANLSQQDMTFYMEAIASDATALIPLLRDGGAGFAELTDEADRLGLVLSELDIAQLVEFGRQADRLTGILSSMGKVVAGELAPYMSVLADEILENTNNAEDFGDAFADTLRRVIELSAPVIDTLDHVALITRGMRAAAYSVGQAYTAVFAEIINAGTTALDFIAGGINELIAGANNLPGVEIDLIASFNSSAYMENVRALADEMSELASEARAGVVEAAGEAPPSEAILSYLDDVDANSRNLAETLPEFESETDNARNSLLDLTAAANDSSDAVRRASSSMVGYAAEAAAGAGTTSGSVRDRIDAGRDMAAYWLPPNPNAHATWDASRLTDTGISTADLAARVAGLAPMSSVGGNSSLPQGIQWASSAGNDGTGMNTANRVPVALSVTDANGNTTTGEAEVEPALVDVLEQAAAGVRR